MGDHHGTPRELLQRVLQRTEGLDVEIVGGFVEQQQIAAFLEGQRQVEPVALTTGEHTGGLLLIGALEPEGRHIGPGRDLVLPDLDVVEPVGDHLPHVLLRVDTGPGLIDIAELDGVPDPHGAAVRAFQSDDGFEQGGLADTVGPDYSDNAVAGQCE